MLKGISPLLSPELLMTLAEMGHGDELVLGDGNFCAVSFASDTVIRADGHSITPLLDAILALFPLDYFVPKPVMLMQVGEGHKAPDELWNGYRKTVERHDSRFRQTDFEYLERFAFYERTGKAFAVVATGETALYANIILKKGVIDPHNQAGGQ